MKALEYGVHPAGYAACLLLRQAWKGCLWTALNGLRLRELPVPPLPGPDWVRCRTLMGGICGSDLAILTQRQPVDSILQSFTTMPMVLGHENVARVEEVGPGVEKSWLGKRVCVEPTLSCQVRGIEPACPCCEAGQYGACQNFSAGGQGRYRLPPGTSLGYCGAVGGSWGEYFLAHQSQLVEVPEAIQTPTAVLTDSLACSLHAALRVALPGVDGRVLVYGAGILGLGVVWALRAIGYAGRIDVIVRHAHQAALAKELGATDALRLPEKPAERFERIAQATGGRVTQARFGNLMLSGGYDVTFECVGGRHSIEEALKWTRSRGQVVLLATGNGRGAEFTPIWFTELTVRGAYGRAVETFAGRRIHTYALTHELMQSHGQRLAGLLTHRFKLEQYKEAFAAATGKSSSGAVKVAFEFGT